MKSHIEQQREEKKGVCLHKFYKRHFYVHCYSIELEYVRVCMFMCWIFLFRFLLHSEFRIAWLFERRRYNDIVWISVGNERDNVGFISSSCLSQMNYEMMACGEIKYSMANSFMHVYIEPHEPHRFLLKSGIFWWKKKWKFKKKLASKLRSVKHSEYSIFFCILLCSVWCMYHQSDCMCNECD